MKAIRYLRFSSDGQSAHSIERQDVITASWLHHNGIELVDTFIDEGYSARTFDRPDLKALFAFIKKNRNINYLLVAELTRFSREAGDAINMVKQIQQQYGIRIVSASRSTIYDCGDSNSFFMMGLEFLLGNSENIKRQSDINGGIYTAKAEKGKWIQGGPAPYGFIKQGSGDARRLVQQPEQAAVVRMIYQLFLERVPVYRIRQLVKPLGFNKTGSDAIHNILKNPLYKGYQYVKPYKNLPGGLFPLKNFEPIISETDWNKVQQLFKSEERTNTRVHDDFPLRSVLRCYCGKFVTGAKSRGRHGGYYPYYKCQQSGHVNLNAHKAHAQLQQVWQTLSLPPRVVAAIKERSHVLLQQRLQEGERSLMAERTNLRKVQQQIESLEEKWINNQVSFETYNRWFGQYNEQRRTLQARVDQLQQSSAASAQLLDQNLNLLSQLDVLWERASTEQRQELVRRVFDNRLYYQNGTYRTPYLHPIFQHNYLRISNKNPPLLIDEEGGILSGGGHPTPIEPLFDLIQFLQQVA